MSDLVMWRVQMPITRRNSSGQSVRVGSSSIWRLREEDALADVAAAPGRVVIMVTGDQIPEAVRARAEAAIN